MLITRLLDLHNHGTSLLPFILQTPGIESSPGLSQFELLFTPHIGTNSVRSGKG